jgi:hypothetical protein
VKVLPLMVVAVAAPSVGVVNTGEVVIATLPEPLTVYSPTTPALSYKTFVVVPEVITVVPIVMPDEPAGVNHEGAELVVAPRNCPVVPFANRVRTPDEFR